VYSKLHFASPGEQDWFPQVPEGTVYMVRELHGLLSGAPGQFLPAIQKALSPEQQQALQNFFASAGVRLQ
jgi:hypothetical protein